MTHFIFPQILYEATFDQPLRKTCQNTGFCWPVFSHVRTEFTILSLYGRMRVSENLYSRIIYAVNQCEAFQIFKHKVS